MCELFVKMCDLVDVLVGNDRGQVSREITVAYIMQECF